MHEAIHDGSGCGVILVTQYVKGVSGDKRYGLKTIPPGGITCSIAASKKEAQAIMSFFSGAIVLVYET